MFKKYLSLLLFISSILFVQKVNAQCQALFNVWQDTSTSAQPSTYFGNNTSQGPNWMGIDTVNFTYTWSWGDGTATTAPFPMHVYSSPGVYTICLYMNPVSTFGCNDTICISQTINKHRVMHSVTIINPFIVTQVTSTAKKNISVYPNPASSSLSFLGLKEGVYQYQILGLDGKLIIEAELKANQSIDIANVAAGMYFIKMRNTLGECTTLPFVK
jgi:Secretion system C-terminal sorting domain/PKD domain